MFQFLKNKILNKKWLNLSLFLGILLLVAVVSSQPMFARGSLNKLLDVGFSNYIAENNTYPTVMMRLATAKTSDYKNSDEIIEKCKQYQDKWLSYIKLDLLANQTVLMLNGGNANSDLDNNNNFVNIVYLPGYEDHLSVVKGDYISDEKLSDGSIPCLISKSFIDNYEIVVGEKLTLASKSYKSGELVTFTVVGVFEESDFRDLYWQENAESFKEGLIVSKSAFDELLATPSFSEVNYNHYAVVDYHGINSKNVLLYLDYLRQIKESDSIFNDTFSSLLSNYKNDARTVNTILWVLSIPMIGLLLTFIYMVSNQILEMETGEIAMLKSRGVSRKQVILVYLMQSMILSAVAITVGVPLGYFLCKMSASTNSFLTFAIKDTSSYGFTWLMYPYAILACMVATVFVILPVIKHAKVSIVQQKAASKRKSEKSFWEKYFLDLILLALASYLLFNYTRQIDQIALDVIGGKAMDPVIFMDSMLFLLACGLIAVRFSHIIVKIVYSMGKKKWKPAMYASFLQIIRSAKKQNMIAIFLVVTIAMGVFNSNVVRTINDNEIKRIQYNMGADVVMQEHWAIRVTKIDGNYDWYYYEPDYQRYDQVKEEYLESMTRVIVDENVEAKLEGKTIDNCYLQGIHTKEFGETAALADNLNDKHWYYSLNELSQVSNGVIISSNMAKEYDIKVGDTITYKRKDLKYLSEEYGLATGVVCDIVDAWPGYCSYSYQYDDEGNLVEQENYLIVANYAYVMSVFSMTPYQVWGKVKKGANLSEMRNALSDAGIRTVYYATKEQEIYDMVNSAIIQITNGMYTLSFVISLLLCAVGFLIYWISSIKQRELLFGIYRAMGMSMGEVNQMLINEHIFSSLIAAVAGGLVGVLSTRLFTRLVAIVYLPERHNIPIGIVIDPFDMLKIIITVCLIFVVCFFVLYMLLKKMKVAQALKLGED